MSSIFSLHALAARIMLRWHKASPSHSDGKAAVHPANKKLENMPDDYTENEFVGSTSMVATRTKLLLPASIPALTLRAEQLQIARFTLRN